MSLQLLPVDLNDTRDRDDLLTIYGHGDYGLHLSPLTGCAGNATRLLREVADHRRLSFYAVRFNDRLIAACVVEQDDAGQYEIDAIAVRASSAGRGVEQRMLAQLARRLASEADSIRIHLRPESREWIADLHLDGFEHEASQHDAQRYRRIHARQG